MKILRTPDERFADLPDFPYEPNYTHIADGGHFLQEGRGEVLASIVSDFVRTR